MTSISVFLFGLVVAGALFALILGVRFRSQARAVDESRMYFASVAPTLEEIELNRPFSERVIRPSVSKTLTFFGRFAPKRNIQEIQRKLEIAGRPNGWSVADLVGLRLLSAMFFGALTFGMMLLADLSPLFELLVVFTGVVIGFYLPLFWLNYRISGRKHAILRALPDGLDMLNICVGAGLGFNAALIRVGERWDTPLADEFNRVATEIQLGKTRRAALLGMAERTDVSEVATFVATIVQAEQLGVSVAKVLRTQAEQMRISRRQRAEEAARQATIKLLFPLVFLIFPSLLAVLLGPAIPQLLRTFSNL